LKGLIGVVGPGRRKRRSRPVPVPPGLTDDPSLALDEGIGPEDLHAMGIEFLNHARPSWLWPRWGRVLDHESLWKDPSPEQRRYLRKVFGRG
jgi:hypothetical protein